jgi:hypothetical protein
MLGNALGALVALFGGISSYLSIIIDSARVKSGTGGSRGNNGCII